jgi:hypothetical protein
MSRFNVDPKLVYVETPILLSARNFVDSELMLSTLDDDRRASYAEHVARMVTALKCSLFLSEEGEQSMKYIDIEEGQVKDQYLLVCGIKTDKGVTCEACVIDAETVREILDSDVN